MLAFEFDQQFGCLDHLNSRLHDELVGIQRHQKHRWVEAVISKKE